MPRVHKGVFYRPRDKGVMSGEQFARHASHCEYSGDRLRAARLCLVHGYTVPRAIEALMLPDSPSERSALRRTVARIRAADKPRLAPHPKRRTLPRGWRTVTLQYPAEFSDQIRALQNALNRKRRAFKRESKS